MLPIPTMNIWEVQNLGKLTNEDELLLVLTRWRVGMLQQDLVARFELSQSHVSRIITTWVNAMFHRFKELEIWPTCEQTLPNLPEKVWEFCPTLRCIIDATEIYIEHPKNPEVQQLTFSMYKNHNTLKSLVGISGDGTRNVLSSLEGGSISDRDLAVKSGIHTCMHTYIHTYIHTLYLHSNYQSSSIELISSRKKNT